jgi:hypothetical protein
MSIAAAFVTSAMLTTACLWAVAKWTHVTIPTIDLSIIGTLCAGLALLPFVGWVLATLIMSLLILRTTEADGWPDTVLMLIGSNIVWLLVSTILLSRM